MEKCAVGENDRANSAKVSKKVHADHINYAYFYLTIKTFSFASYFCLCRLSLFCFICMQDTSSAKKNDVASQQMIVCTKCKNTLPAVEFAKSQLKKKKKGKPCICVGCSAKMRGAKIPAKSGASSSAKQVIPRQSLHTWEGAIRPITKFCLERFPLIRGQFICNFRSKSPSPSHSNHVIPARAFLPASACPQGLRSCVTPLLFCLPAGHVIREKK